MWISSSRYLRNQLLIAAVVLFCAAAASSSEPRWNQDALASLLDYAKTQDTSGLIITQSGETIAEAHWLQSGFGIHYLFRYDSDDEALEDVASMQKSVVGVLAVMAMDRELLEPTTPVVQYLGKGWSEANEQDEGRILVHHLLSMSSGLDSSLEYQAAAGTLWQYNTNAYSLLIPILEKVTQLEIETLTEQWLTTKLGMQQSSWRTRRWVLPGMDANKIGFASTARDMQRLGELILANGKWAGQQLISETHVALLTEPSQSLNPSYSYLWWLNGSGLISTAPEDLIAAQGMLGRKIYIVPSMDLVVTRLGKEPEKAFDEVFWQKLLLAAPQS